MRYLVAALVAVAVLGGSAAAPAGGGEVHETTASHRSALAEPLTRAEVRRAVELLLVDYLGPAVSSDNGAPAATVWHCRAYGVGGDCRGSVRAGAVTCRGVFRVRQTSRAISIFPGRAVCGTAPGR